MNLTFDYLIPHTKQNLVMESLRISNSYPKSPLRYPGGKARAVKIILSLIPADTQILISPFFGGGSIEIAAAHFGVRVIGFDIFDPLVAFWNELLKNPKELADSVQKYFPLEKKRFYDLQKTLPVSQLDLATQFYVLNRSSFSGATLSGGMSPGHPRFTQSSIEYLRNFNVPNLSVQKQDFKLTLEYEKNNLLYLDPPYLINSSLYGRKGNTHKNFDHNTLYKMLNKLDMWILSYNNCEEIKELYKGFRILYPEWKYGMSNDKGSKELLILSNGFPDVVGGKLA